jgi:hypothetical protein
MLPTGTGNGAYEDRKNGYYVATNLYAWFRPVSFLEGYFKLYNVARPGSFYTPLSLEANSEQTFGISLDRAYGRINVFDALDISLPFQTNLFLKTGKFKGEPRRFNVISRFELENIMHRLETANTYNYEIEAEIHPLDNDFAISASFVGNYLFDEGIQRLHDNDGGVSLHGRPYLGDNGTIIYAPQFMAFLRLKDLGIASNILNLELIYGQNVADIYSGNCFGIGLKFDLNLNPDTFSIPIGIGFTMYEKNIDVLSRTSSTSRFSETYDFRDTLNCALSLGLHLTSADISFETNLGFLFSSIDHIYRDNLQILSMSLDAQCTLKKYFFIGAGFIAGTLTDAQWKTKETIVASLDNGGYDHTFTFADNFGYEVYGGINLWTSTRFVIGFNQNRGLAMNYNLENKPEGLIKYKLAGSNNVVGELPKFETSGLYMKFIVNW